MSGFPYDGTLDRDEDEDERREAIDERRARSRATRCQCGNDLPGYCPGPMNCPHSDFAVEQEEAPDLAEAEAEYEERREAACASGHRRRISACIDHTGGRFRGF